MIKNREILLKTEIPEPILSARMAIIDGLNHAFDNCNPEKILISHIDSSASPPYLVAVGKAAYPMLKPYLNFGEIEGGILVTNAKIEDKLDKIKYFKGGHPYPNRESLKSAEYFLQVLKTKNPQKLIFLISGGGSAMFELPRIPLKDLITINKLLLSSGANIEEINTVRKHLSKIKGGQLINYLNTKAHAFLMSDVIHDRIDLIASGLTTCDPSTFEDTYEVLKKYDLWERAPKSVRAVTSAGLEGRIPETFKDCKLASERVDNTIILRNADFLSYLAKFLKLKGYIVLNLGSDFHLKIEEMVEFLIRKMKELTDANPKSNIAIVAGGEIYLQVKGKGKGGRNQELTLRLAKEMEGKNKKFVFAAIGTDGIDGLTDAAGAICDNETIFRAKRLSLNPEKYLRENDSYNFFKRLNDLIITGHTGINVKDVYCLIVLRDET